ncbi:MAG TPA: hypothetical protein PKD48_10800 [Sphingopyxis sp.]|nr:hypothetical protein [Sphingopyxis sp.]HMQ19232.1 hypothetical protein [Sphingopyxis sp.]
MPKFDMGAAWDDATLLLRSHTALTGAIAAVFLFLPTLAVSWFGPVPIEAADGASFDQAMAALRETMRQALPYQLGIALVAAVGGVGVLRLWLSRESISVGDALVFALRMLPTVVGLQILVGAGLFLIALLLLLPGIAAGAGGGGIGLVLIVIGLLLLAGICAYLWARISVASAVIADQQLYNPARALGESWALTKDNGWRIFLFLFLVLVVIIILSMLFGGVAHLAFGTGEGIGRIVTGLVEAGLAMIGGIVSLAVAAAVYRQLATRDAGDVFA